MGVTFWQEIVLWILGHKLSRWVPKAEKNDAEIYLSCFLITGEMAILSFFMLFTYGSEDYRKKKIKTQ